MSVCDLMKNKLKGMGGGIAIMILHAMKKYVSKIMHASYKKTIRVQIFML
jgi:hypothetical protein